MSVCFQSFKFLTYSNLGLGKPASASWPTPFSGVKSFHVTVHVLFCAVGQDVPLCWPGK